MPKQNNVLRWNQKVEWTEPDDINHNYLWIGDKFKIEETQDGKLKIRKRFLDKIPESIKLAGGTLDDIKEFFKLNELDLSKIRLGQWLDYMKSLPNKNNSTLNDIFGESALDYQEEKILL